MIVYSNIPLKYRIAMEALRMIASDEVKGKTNFAAKVRNKLMSIPNTREDAIFIEIDKNGKIAVFEKEGVKK